MPATQRPRRARYVTPAGTALARAGAGDGASWGGGFSRRHEPIAATTTPITTPAIFSHRILAARYQADEGTRQHLRTFAPSHLRYFATLSLRSMSLKQTVRLRPPCLAL